jgi:hypothetical protein
MSSGRNDPPARPMSTDDILRKRQRASLIGGSSGVTSSWPGTSSLPQASHQGQGRGLEAAAAGVQGVAAGTGAAQGSQGEKKLGQHKPATKVAKLGGVQASSGAANRAATQSEAQRRLAALHARSGKASTAGGGKVIEAAGMSQAVGTGASGASATAAGSAGAIAGRGMPLPVFSPNGVLTSSQRLHNMTPAIIPPDYMRRAGHFGNQISQAVQGYNRYVLLRNSCLDCL